MALYGHLKSGRERLNAIAIPWLVAKQLKAGVASHPGGLLLQLVHGVWLYGLWLNQMLLP